VPLAQFSADVERERKAGWLANRTAAPKRSGRPTATQKNEGESQSFGASARMVDGGTAASTDIIADILRASNSMRGGSKAKSMLTGRPAASMSAPVGSRNVISLIFSPWASTGFRSLKVSGLICGGGASSATASSFGLASGIS
jgi:hypothetical protein